MKTLVLRCAPLLGALSIAGAQSPTPAPRPNYFGTTNPNGTDPVAAAKDNNDPASRTSAAAGEKRKAAQPTDAQAPEPAMKNVLPLLTTAKEKLRMTTSSNSKSEALAIAEAVLEALKKTSGDGRYHGHRVKAMDKVKESLTELRAGDRENKANGFLSESIAEVNLCLGLAK